MEQRWNCKIYSFLLCHHSLFAHQTVRAMPLLRLTFAAHADEASLSPFTFASIRCYWLKTWQILIYYQLKTCNYSFMKRKIYSQLLDWKQNSKGKTALLIEGARRIGKSYIVTWFAQNEYKTSLIFDFINATSEVGKRRRACLTICVRQALCYCFE